MEAIDSHYDSDDDFAWGPVTPREIRRYLNDRAAEAIVVDRRRTIRYNSPPSTNRSDQQEEEYDFEKLKALSEDVSKLSIQSKYFTPNETDNDSYRTAPSGDSSKIVDCDLSEATESSEDECLKNAVKDIIEKLKDDFDENSVIVLSDSDSESELFSAKNESELLPTKYESKSFSTKYESESCSTKYDSESSYAKSQSESPPAKNKSEPPFTKNVSESLSTKNELELPPVNDESIYDFNDSITEQDSLMLNDTMEEMKRALANGLDYSMSDGNQSRRSERKSPIYTTPKNTKPSQLRPPAKYDNVLSPVSNYIRQSPREFKMPKQPLKKYQSPLTKTKPLLSMRDVKSPVGLYIKNSTTTLQKNVPNVQLPRFIPKSLLSPVENKPAETNRAALPSVVYKPAKKKVVGKGENSRLPTSIQKYVSLNAKVIKHEGRVVNQTKGRNVKEKLLDDDLTINNISLFDNTQDVSIMTSRAAIID